MIAVPGLTPTSPVTMVGPVSCVICMRVRDYCALNGRPRVDVKVAAGAIQSRIAHFKELRAQAPTQHSSVKRRLLPSSRIFYKKRTLRFR